MALISTYGIPLAPTHNLAAGTYATFSLSGSTSYVATLMMAPKTGTITKVGAYVSAVTGTQPVWRFAIEGTTTTRVPDGTVLGSGTAKADVSGLTTGFAWRTLDAGIAVNSGDYIAATMRYLSGTVGGSNFATICSTAVPLTRTLSPFTTTYNGTTQSPQTTGCGLCIQYSDGYVPSYCLPLTAAPINNSWNSSGSPVYRGNAWTPQFNGIVGFVDICIKAADAGYFNLLIYKNNSASADVTQLVKFNQIAAANSVYGIIRVPTNYSFTQGNTYRFILQPTTATAITSVYSYKFIDSDSQNSYAAGLNYTSASSPGTWTDSNAYETWPIIPVITQIEIPGICALI